MDEWWILFEIYDYITTSSFYTCFTNNFMQWIYINIALQISSMDQ